MDHITKFVEEKIAPPLIKFSQYRYIQVIQRTGLGIMSLLIIGSIFTLLSAFPVPAYQNFIGGFKTTLASAAGSRHRLYRPLYRHHHLICAGGMV